MYQLIKSPFTGETNCVKRIADNAFIPSDMGNGDYIQYLNWLAEGNTPEPADEPAQGE